AAKNNLLDTGSVEDLQCSFTKIISAFYGENIGQFDHEIDPVLDGGLCSMPLICDSGFTALDKVAAHDSNQQIALGKGAGLFNMVAMDAVKWIVFDDNSGNLHDRITPLFLYSSIQKGERKSKSQEKK